MRRELKQYFKYLLKWELGTFIMSPTIYYLSDLGPIFSVILGNLIGSIVFYPIDRKIFSTKNKNGE